MMQTRLKKSTRLKSAAIVISGGVLGFAGLCTYSGQERFYREILMPSLRVIDAEKAHELSIKMASWGIVPRNKYVDPESLKTKVWGREFSNPVGVAAGFDKHADGMSGLLKMGFGFVEIGSVTPEPQPGNPKPRVFRLLQDRAIINRYGFNSVGHEAVYQSLSAWRNKSKGKTGLLGINLGKNKESTDAVGDYVKGVKKLGPLADYIVINISSPNTPGLRKMQGKQQLQELIEKVLEARNHLQQPTKPIVLIKIAPDLSVTDKEDIASVIMDEKLRVDGLIVSNTTVSRPESLLSPEKTETGGLSGPPLKEMATDTVKDMYKLTQGQLPIIGVGGVSNGDDAYQKIRAGASLVQLYSALAYDGPPVVKRIKKELEQLLRNDGFKTVAEAVGVDSSIDTIEQKTD
ncbi:dihydroorotate dehydrogenase (quinone), mitochondrial-like [Glandiceps talaboti]